MGHPLTSTGRCSERRRQDRAGWISAFRLTIYLSACKILPAPRTECKPAEIAQLVEHATENRGVASSILALGTKERAPDGRAAIERKWLSW